MKKCITIKNGVLTKKYQQSELLSNPSIIRDRVSKINSFDTDRYSSISKTTIKYKKNAYYYEQAYWNKLKCVVDIPNLYRLAESLEYLSSIKFIHGDLNRKNIIYTLDGYKIIDFELDLYQIRNGIKQIIVTRPYIAESDISHNKITSLTDKIGFIYFLLRISKQINSKEIVNLSRHFNHQKYIHLSEEEIESITYKGIIQKYIDS